MVFGTPIAVPGQFIPPSASPSLPSEHLRTLREIVGSLTPIPTSRHSVDNSFIPKSLKEAQYVFVRRGPHSGPLETPYLGPYKVIGSGSKTFKLDFGGREEIVSIDRLKPAHLDASSHVATAIPPRGGRPPLKNDHSISRHKHPASDSTTPNAQATLRRNPAREARPTQFSSF